MPKIDLDTAPVRERLAYPAPFAAKAGDKRSLRLAQAAGLSQLGANLSTLAPGQMSALRHWHEVEDELVFVVSGTVTLVEEDTRTPLGPGEIAAFPAGVANGHHLINEGQAAAVILELASRAEAERAHYPDDDLVFSRDAAGRHFTRRDGTPIE